MRKTSKLVTALVTTAAVMTVGIASAEAAGRGNGQGGGYGMMNGNGAGIGYGRQGSAVGDCINLYGVESGTVTAAQRSALIAMAGEEKLAHDVYVALAAKFPAAPQFARIATAESRHLAAVRTLLKRYAIADPTAGMAAGVFANAGTQALYTDLVAKAVDTASALKVGVQIETLDIADLKVLLTGMTAPDVNRVLANLLRASQMHLRAFSI